MTTIAITNVRHYEGSSEPRPTWYIIEGGRVLTHDGAEVEEQPRPGGAEYVQKFGPPPAADVVVDGRGLIIAPGYVDIHVHGGGGYSLMTDDIDEARAYARWVVRHGVTSFLISTSGRDHAQIVRRLKALTPAIGVEPGAARILGFHLEGPYINPIRKGAFDPRWLRPPNVEEYRELVEASGNNIRMMTLAPELRGSDDLIRAVVDSGATAAMGHTDATYEQARHAIDLGVTHVTHCFNAMRPFSHRDPGVLGAALEQAVRVELIGDGQHVGWVAARLLNRMKQRGKIVLATDAMPLAGTPDGEAEWEGVAIRVEGGKAVRASDGTIIGGITTLDQMVRNAVRYMGVSSPDAIAMASLNPAAALRGLEDICGSLTPLCTADFVLLDGELRVTETWVAGERVYAAEETQTEQATR